MVAAGGGGITPKRTRHRNPRSRGLHAVSVQSTGTSLNLLGGVIAVIAIVAADEDEDDEDEDEDDELDDEDDESESISEVCDACDGISLYLSIYLHTLPPPPKKEKRKKAMDFV